MRLSEWQIKRIRDALRFYHQFESSHDGDSFHWNDVAEAISLYTGVDVPFERIRKFVEGETKDEGRLHFPVPQGERIKAIYDFVTDPELELLSVEELTEREFSAQAAMRLLDYLDQDFDGVRVMPPDMIEGTYLRKQKLGHQVRISELIFEKPLANGIIKTTQTDRTYDEADLDRSGAGLKADRQSANIYNGWAILTPEDNLMLFLKNSRNGRNLYYFTLASDLTHVSSQRTNYFAMLRHDYPLEVEKPSDLKFGTDTYRQIEENLFLFSQSER